MRARVYPAIHSLTHSFECNINLALICGIQLNIYPIIAQFEYKSKTDTFLTILMIRETFKQKEA